MIDQKKVTNIVEEYLKNSELFLVNINVAANNRISVFIDGDKGVRIEDCVSLSRHIEKNLDRDIEDFELEVSSVGVDKPLVLNRQFKKNIGKQITFLDNENNKVKAKLSDVFDDYFMIERVFSKKNKKKEQVKQEKEKIAYSDAKNVKVEISFK